MSDEVRFHSSLPADAVRLHAFTAHESLGRLPEYRVELLRPQRQRALQAEDLLGKTAGVSIRIDQGRSRHFQGLVTEFERGGVRDRHDLYRLVLHPWLWRLTPGTDSRVFQEQTVVQILEAVFAGHVGGGDVEKRLTGRYAARPYTVQYAESDFNFVSRLMEDEGIHYFFRHEATRHVLVLCDNRAAHPAMPGRNLAWWARQSGQSAREDTVLEWSRTHRLQPRRFTQVDFAAETPGSLLSASAEHARGTPGIEVYRHAGGADDLAMAGNLADKQAGGQDNARREIDRFESRHCVARGLTHFRDLGAGQVFSLQEHPDADDYLCVSSVTEIGFPADPGEHAPAYCDYSCRFEAVARAVNFVPERSAPRPVARGPETALVVGPEGEEIHTDRFGRVRLQFHWDRQGRKDERSSCWVRVSHGGASRQFGQMSLPRIGDEVVVDFLDGNPDRPLVTGRVYNGDNLPPYELPAQATVSGMRSRSSKGGSLDNANELRFDDRKDHEYVWLQAERDLHQKVRNDAFTTVGRDQRAEIGGLADIRIAKELTATVGGELTLKISGDSNAGLDADLMLAVGGAANVNVGQALSLATVGGMALASGAGLDIAVGAGVRLSAAASVNLQALAVVIDAGSQLCLRAGASFITLGPDGVSIHGASVRINSGGAPLTTSSFAPVRPARPKGPGDAPHDRDPLAGT